MKLLVHTLCLCLALALAWADVLEENPHDDLHHTDPHGHPPDRCEGIEMDAATVNEAGVPYVFKGHSLFKGFHGEAEPTNETFTGHDDNFHLSHIDAAFHMHNEHNASEHDHTFIFSGPSVYRFHQHKLEEGYPKPISNEFHGIPDHLDAAVECPKGDCEDDLVIFFKGHEIFHFNINSKSVAVKEYESMPNCTSAFRFMGNYYCFHGHMFSKFDPKTGEVHGKYPKEARDFFMRCSKFSNESNHVERERCSRVPLDAITADSAGHIYAFRGHYFLRKDDANDTMTADTIGHLFKEVHSDVDAVFSHHNHLHMFKGENAYAYNVAEPHDHLDGNPKTVKEVLGLDGPIDAAFICEGDIAHVIRGPNMISVDMKANPPAAVIEHPISIFKKVDAAMCHGGGLKVIVGNHFYHFDDPMGLVSATTAPEPHKVSMELFGCDH
ncbi:Hypothetical predicted protein [Xyrichtys novacula]|uniref:Hemopexin n=1 Tax=Xyrichtys novacula TaxID=13765 RepID=A0AAV1H243_XYRNO|nr:Hypothetical predicted protein [Xyrichtys novacula]